MRCQAEGEHVIKKKETGISFWNFASDRWVLPISILSEKLPSCFGMPNIIFAEIAGGDNWAKTNENDISQHYMFNYCPKVKKLNP